MYGIYCGPDAIIDCTNSSFLSMRAGGYAIKSLNPKQLKFVDGSVYKCEGNGVHVIIDDTSMHAEKRKVYIENGRFSHVIGCSILIEGSSQPGDPYIQYRVKVRNNRALSCGLDSKIFNIPGATEAELALEKEQLQAAC